MQLLPQANGYLPFFLIYTSIAAFIHSAVCYLAPPSMALKQFSGDNSPEPNGLLARVYGVKNVYTGLIRLYAAYHLTGNQPLYDLAIWTYVGVILLYAGELLVWKTSRPREMVFPFVNAGVGLLWMLSQRGWYIRA